MFLTIYLAIVDIRSWSFDAPSKGRLSRGRQHVACYVVWAASDTDISHTLSFYFPNIIGLVQRIVRFVMRTELKASYRTVQYEYAYRYTPSIYVRLCVCGVCVDLGPYSWKILVLRVAPSNKILRKFLEMWVFPLKFKEKILVKKKVIQKAS